MSNSFVVGFFELRLSGILRFPLWLYPRLIEIQENLEFVYFYDEEDISPSEVMSQLSKKSKLVRISRPKHVYINGLLKEYDVSLLVVFAQRIPDSCLVACAKKLGIPTVMYQHGLYIPFMKREWSLFFYKLGKSIRFLRYVIATADILGLSRLWLVSQYFKLFVKGERFQDLSLPSSAINVDRVLVYGEYWKEYHSRNYGYSNQDQYVVGAPDFADIDTLKNQSLRSNTVCYIAQSLVEDGRLPRQLMVEFVNNLATAVVQSNAKLFVRLHPRSDLTLYSGFPSDTEFSKTEFPRATAYFGHYSSIISKSVFFSDNLYLVDFPNHAVPKYLSMLASERIDYSDVSTMSRTIKVAMINGVDHSAVNQNISKQNHYFDSSIGDPLKEAAVRVLELSAGK